MKILIVEDEPIMASLLETILTRRGWQVVAIAQSAQEAFGAMATHGPDLVLMDILINGPLSGCEAAVRIRAEYPRCAILFLTAYAEEEMMQYAAQAKADGYLLKPYNEQEIIASIHLIQSRRQTDRLPQTPHCPLLNGGYRFDPKNGRLCGDRGEVRLTAQMLALLKLLSTPPAQTLPSEQISLALWGNLDSSGHLRTLIHRLHKKVGCELIENFRGIGYRLILAQS